MIGLQTKRLSGAQQKRLTRERKMKEGTLTEKKPPRKTPSSQEKGVVGSSGGVQRPHSDSSTPSLGKQEPKKPRNTQVQTGSYKEAVAGIKITVIHRRHPDVKLDQTQADMIQVKLDCCGCKPFRAATTTVFVLQICTGSILDYLCK
jgi:hypothetical protein